MDNMLQNAPPTHSHHHDYDIQNHHVAEPRWDWITTYGQESTAQKTLLNDGILEIWEITQHDGFY